MVLLGVTAVARGSLVYMLDVRRVAAPLMLSVPFYGLALFIACLFCHAELHRLRPSPHQATSFYLLIAAGGALGSIFVGVMAPMMFSANYELAYGLVLAAVLALAVTWSQGIGGRLFWSAASLGVTAVLLFVQAGGDGQDTISRLGNFYGTLRATQHPAPPFNAVTRL